MGEKERERENDGEKQCLGKESAQTGLGLKSITLLDDAQEKDETGRRVIKEEDMGRKNNGN